MTGVGKPWPLAKTLAKTPDRKWSKTLAKTQARPLAKTLATRQARPLAKTLDRKWSVSQGIS